jgi:hypothetical protein
LFRWRRRVYCCPVTRAHALRTPSVCRHAQQQFGRVARMGDAVCAHGVLEHARGSCLPTRHKRTHNTHTQLHTTVSSHWVQPPEQQQGRATGGDHVRQTLSRIHSVTTLRGPSAANEAAKTSAGAHAQCRRPRGTPLVRDTCARHARKSADQPSTTSVSAARVETHKAALVACRT